MATTGRRTVAPGEVVASEWGNDVWDQSVQCFDTAADRDAQFPVPQAGAMCFLADQQNLYVYRGSAWVPLRTVTGAVAAGNVTFTGTTDLETIAVTFPAGRFTAQPAVTATPWSSDPAARTVSVTGIAPSGFNLIGRRTAGGSYGTSWIAAERV